MAKSVLELAVGTGQWNAGLKKAKLALDNFTQANGGLSQALDREGQKMQKFVKMIGSMDSTAKTAKGQMNDYKSSIEQLTMQYNRMSEAQKNVFGQSYLQTIEQLKEKYRAVNEEIQEMNRSLSNSKMPEISTGGNDGLSSMMAVFGGNMMTKGVELLTSALSNLGNQMMDISQKAMEMSVNSEGILMAFQRLDNPALLDQLRQATHGTVSDLELMKAAVKFDDFNLPVEELGTMLAFAQQKAKDTGQSIDYMVDSIVTGLGRKSLMILDNLGLSSTQIKERMGETGDMTKAVGEIIREQMSSAGDYVETAADRAARANAELENSYIELGNRMRETFGIGSVEELNTYINRELITTLEFTTDWVGRVQNAMSGIVGVFNDIKEASPFADMLEDIVALYTPLTALLGLQSLLFGNNKSTGITGGAGTGGFTPKPETESSFSITTDSNGNVINASRNGTDVTSEYLKSLKLKPKTPKKGGGGGGSTTQEKTEEQLNSDKIKKLSQEYIYASDDRRKAIEAEIKTLQDRNAEIRKLMDAAQGKLPAPEGSQKALGEELSKLQQDRQLLSDPIAIDIQDQAIQEVQDKIDRLNGKKVEVELAVDSRSAFEKLKDSLNIELAEQNMQVDTTTLQTLIKTAIQNGIDELDPDFASLQEKMNEGMNIPDETWQALQDEINEKLKELGIDPIKIDFKTGNISKDGEKAKDSWQDAAKAVQSVGSAMQNIEDPAAKVAGTVLQAVANVALGYANALTMAKEAGGPWGWIAFAATGLATMMTTISAIHSATGYAEGGMVKGNSYSGDNLQAMIDGGTGGFAGLNSGEIVLNRAAQGNLASQLEGAGANTHLSASVSGEQILLVANRTTRRQGKGELVTWR